MLLHAFPLDKRLWDGVVDAVADSGWDVVVPDLRGFGESSFGDDGPDDEPSLTLMARDVLAMLDRIGEHAVVVAGVSMGGYVAMAMLREDPSRVAGLVLVDTKATADSDEAWGNRLRVAERVLEAGSTEALARTMLPSLLGPRTLEERPEVAEQVRGWIEEADPAAVAWAQRAMAERPDSRDDLAAFVGPSLVIFGEDDALSPRAEQDLMVAALRDVRVVPLPDVGHLAPIEAPAAVADALVSFLVDVRRLPSAD